VLASAIESLIEVGGSVVSHCEVGDLACWVSTTVALLAEREKEPVQWEQRRRQGLQMAARFSWRKYAEDMSRIYEAVHAS